MYQPISIIGKLFKLYLLFPSHPSKIRIESIIGKLCFPYGIKIKNEDGVVFKLDPNDWITRTILEQGYYERASIELGKKILQTGAVFVDIGANFGLFSCSLGKCNSGLKIISVEPNYQVIPRLVNNIKLNNLNQQVQVVNAAVSDQIQFVFLELAEKNNLGTTGTSFTDNGGIAVLSCAMDYILKTNYISEVDLIKIDIEGNEFTVLENFPFEKYLIRNILLEFNFLSKITLSDLKIFFNSKEFDLFTVNGERITCDTIDIPENNIWVSNRQQTQ